MLELCKPREAKLMGKPDDCIGSDEEPLGNVLKRDVVNIIAQYCSTHEGAIATQSAGTDICCRDISDCRATTIPSV